MARSRSPSERTMISIVMAEFDSWQLGGAIAMARKAVSSRFGWDRETADTCCLHYLAKGSGRCLEELSTSVRRRTSAWKRKNPQLRQDNVRRACVEREASTPRSGSVGRISNRMRRYCNAISSACSKLLQKKWLRNSWKSASPNRTMARQILNPNVLRTPNKVESCCRSESLVVSYD